VRMSFGIIATLGAIALLIYGASKLPFIGGAYLSFIIWFHEIVVQLFS
jgi:Sec-independent protein translocase protein TatA